MLCRLATAAFGALLVSGFTADTPAVSSAGAAGLTRIVFASVVTKDGAPVTDLTRSDFEVKDGGKTQEITSVKLSATPLRLHVIVSDGGTGAFQLGVLRLAQALVDRAEFAFTSVLVQPDRVMPFTANRDLIGAGLQRLGRRGSGQGGSQLMEAIMEALQDIAAPGKHPVLIVLRVGSEGTSTISAATVREAVRQTGTTLYVVSRSGASKAAPTYAGADSMNVDVARRQNDNAELADASLHLNLVLGDGSRESGGYQQEIALTTAVATLEQLAGEIKNQYEIAYALPEGTKPSDRLQVTTTRKNVTVRAPLKVAN